MKKQYRYFRPKIETGFTTIDTTGNKPKTIRQHLILYRYLKALHHAEYLPMAKSFAIWNGKHFELKGDDFIKMFAQKNYKNPEVVSIGDRNTFLELVKINYKVI